MWKVILVWFVSVFIIQPVSCVVGFILRFFYNPPRLTDEFKSYQEKYSHDPESFTLEKMSSDRDSTFNYERLITSGDCAKFLGMYYFATEKEYVWEDVMRLCDKEHKVLHRTPYVEDPENETFFSTDMLSGFLAAISHRLLTKGLTDNERETLSVIWDHSTFDGIPLVLDHISKGKQLNRNCIYEPWRVWDTQEDVRLLVWLKLGYLITNKNRYNTLYWMFLLGLFPSFMISVFDGTIELFNKIYFESSHCSHSAMLNCMTAYRLSDNYLFKFIDEQRWNRRKYTSPDEIALQKSFYGRILTDQEKMIFYNLCYSTYMKGTSLVPMNHKKLDLSGFEIKERTRYYVSPKERGADYSDERSMTKSVELDEKERQEWSLDVIFPINVYLKYNKN